MDGLCPLDVAEQMGDDRMVNLLISHGAKRPGKGLGSIFSRIRSVKSMKSEDEVSRLKSARSARSDEVRSLRSEGIRSCLSQRDAQDCTKEEQVRSDWV